MAKTQANVVPVPLWAAQTLFDINDTTLTTVYLAACTLHAEGRRVTERAVSELVEDADDTEQFHRSLAEELATLVMHGFLVMKEGQPGQPCQLVLTGRRRAEWDRVMDGSLEEWVTAIAEIMLKIDPASSKHALVKQAQYLRENADAA